MKARLRIAVVLVIMLGCVGCDQTTKAIARGHLALGQTVSLLAGGGLGNLIDRIADHGNVTDFLNVGIGLVRTGIFNVADTSLMAGVALLIIGVSRPRLRE